MAMWLEHRHHGDCRQCSLLVTILVPLAIVLSGCNCATGNENTCFKEHCPSNANPNVCLENDRHDLDCCAAPGDSSCLMGFSIRGPSSHRCHFIGAVTTCCIPNDENGDGIQDWEEPSPRWWFLIFGGVLGFTFCFTCCFGCASHDPLKNYNDAGVAWRKMWISVGLVCFMCTVGFYVVMSPNSNSERERGMLTLFGTIGDGLGCAVGFIVCCIILQPRLRAKLASRWRPPPASLAPGGVSHWPAHNPEVALPPQQQSGMVVGTVVTSQPASNASVVAAVVPASSSSRTPSLKEMADVFKRELGLKSEGVSDIVAEACGSLAVKTQGLSLIQQAEKCWETLMGTSGGPSLSGPSLDTGGSNAIVVGRPVQDQMQQPAQTAAAVSESVRSQGVPARAEPTLEENPEIEKNPTMEQWTGDDPVDVSSAETKRHAMVPIDVHEKLSLTEEVKETEAESSAETKPDERGVIDEVKETEAESSAETKPGERRVIDEVKEIEAESSAETKPGENTSTEDRVVDEIEEADKSAGAEQKSTMK